MLYKKLLLLFTLFSVSASFCMDQATIETQEGQEFKVGIELVKLSETLKNLIEDAGTDVPLPLPNITGDTWATIQNLLPYVRDIKRGAQDAQQNKDTISAALKSLNGTSLIEFIIAVNYLDISILLALAIDVAKQIDIKKITPAQIAALPKEIRNHIIFGQIINILGPLQSIPVVELKGHNHAIFSVYVTPDGSKVVSGSDDKTIRVWDINNTGLPLVFNDHSYVRAVCVTPDGSKIVSGLLDGTVRVLNIKTGMQLQVFFGHALSVLSVFVTPDGSKIVSGSADGTIRIWDIKTGAAIAVLRGHTRNVNSVYVTPDGKNIISGSDDTTIRIWDINTHQQLFMLSGHTGAVNAVWVTPDGTNIVSGSSDHTVRVWDINSKKQLAQLESNDYGVVSVCVSPDGSKIISASHNVIQVWDIKSNKRLAVFNAPRASSVCITPEGRKIVAGSTYDFISIFDISIFNRLSDINMQQAGGIWSYLQGDHKAGWQPILNMPQVFGTRVIPPAMPMPVLPEAPRDEGGQSAQKRHKTGE